MFYKKELLKIPIVLDGVKKGKKAFFNAQVAKVKSKDILVITVYSLGEATLRIFIDKEKWVNYFFQKERWNNNVSYKGLGLYGDFGFSHWDDDNATDKKSLKVLDDYYNDKKTLNGYLEDIYKWQSDIVRKKETALAQKHAGENTEIKDFINTLKFPQSIDPKKVKDSYFYNGFYRWALEYGGEFYCTRCKRTFSEEYQKYHITCPHCGYKAHTHAVRKTREINTDTSITEFFKKKDVVYAVVYRVERRYFFNKSGRFLKEGFLVKEQDRSFPRELYLFKDGKVITLASWYSNYYMGGEKYWMEGGNWDKKPFFREYACPNFVLPPAQKVLKGTPLQHSHPELLQEYNNISLLRYFYIFYKNPNIENLITNGFDNLVWDVISKKVYKGSINLKKVKLNDILGVNRDEQKRIKKENWDTKELAIYKSYKKQGKILDNDTLIAIYKLCSKDRTLENKVLNDCKLGFYLLKQSKKRNANVLNFYKDYINMATQAGYNLEDEKLLYPPHLENAHNILMRKVKYSPDTQRNQKYAALKTALKEFEVSKDGLCLIVPNDDYDLFLEGKVLDHCVGGTLYMDNHIKGRCIFFIRNSKTADIPYYTLNFDIKTGKQIQLHGYDNDRKTPIPQNVFDFIAWWKEHVFRKFDVEKMEFIEKPKKHKQKAAA